MTVRPSELTGLCGFVPRGLQSTSSGGQAHGPGEQRTHGRENPVLGMSRTRHRCWESGERRWVRPTPGVRGPVWVPLLVSASPRGLERGWNTCGGDRRGDKAVLVWVLPPRLAFWIFLDLLCPVLLALSHQPETLCWQTPLSLLEASLPLTPGLQPAVLLAVPQCLVGPLLVAGEAADP